MEDPLLAFPTGHSELVMYGTGVQSIDQMPHVLFWRVECYRAKEAAKAALKCYKFAKEQYEKELAAAPHCIGVGQLSRGSSAQGSSPLGREKVIRRALTRWCMMRSRWT